MWRYAALTQGFYLTGGTECRPLFSTSGYSMKRVSQMTALALALGSLALLPGG
jgi:thiosulfate/3-mercaptopyruvate sulfurtransferase